MNLHVTTADRTLLPRGLIKRPRSAAELRIVDACGRLVEASNEARQPPAVLPPRVPVRRFKFRLGARVVFGGMSATVVERSASWCGRQLYWIKISGEAYGRPVRLVAANGLERLSE
ncbi:hypothetical protein ACCS87_02515 [Rhizobium ruizarguesonis]